MPSSNGVRKQRHSQDPPLQRTLTLGNTTALRALPSSATICPVMSNKATRSITGPQSFSPIRKGHSTSWKHFIRICSYIYFSRQREQAVFKFHCNTIESLD